MKKIISFILFAVIILIYSCKKDAARPTVTTADITGITTTSLLSGGKITETGGADVTASGVCYGLTSNPVVTGQHTDENAGSGSFESAITGLTPNTLYYVRAYATNSVGTSYGNELTATTTQLTAPTLTTVNVTSISSSTAVSGGNITADGNDSITVKGVCWATTANPTTTNAKTTDGTGRRNFVSNLTGLLAGLTYHVRAYATNSIGTSYGNEVTFNTTAVLLPTLTTATVVSITINSATSGGTISADGGGAITARGVCWSASANPTILNSKTIDGSGSGVFQSNVTGLSASTTYHLRAYATNSAGTGYGNDIMFVTASPLLPILSTAAVSSITLTTASSGGTIISDGGGPLLARGACWATTANPTIANSKTSDGTGNGTYASALSGLLPGTTYHTRAYATNVTGTSYGNDVSFTTLPVTMPVLTTAAVISIDLTTAVSGGIITADGGGAITAKGVCWSTLPNPATTDPKTTNGTGTADFVSNLTGLASGSTYYVRAYATNSAGTAYGNQVSFNTKIADVEGNKYSTVTIGTQIWMAENLRTITFNNNLPITNITDNNAWVTDSIAKTPAYCWYNNDITNKALYGAVYNWYTVATGNLCPSGWHVPTDAEFQTLEVFLGMDPGTAPGQVGAWGWRGTDQGSQMKSTTGWTAGLNSSNSSGFTGLPGGYRYGLSGVFNDLGNLTYWWSSSDLGDPINATYRRLDGTSNGVFRGAVRQMGGKYIRCLKN